MKHLLKKLSLCLLLGIIFCGVSGGVAIASDNVKLEAEDRTNISQVIDEFFGERASIMIANDKVSSVGACFSRRNLSEELKFRKCIDDFRGDLKKDGETYSSYRTSSEIESFQAKADLTASARVNESTFTTIAKNDVETGYAAHHDIVLKKLSNGKWQIMEDRQLEPTGLIPLYLAEGFVDASSPYKESESGSLDAGESADKEKPASTRKEDSSPNEKKSLSNYLGYSYQAMGKYLEKYWKNYNQAYRRFDGAGGDCTNFVSQALKAGGWSDVPGWYKNANFSMSSVLRDWPGATFYAYRI